MANPASFAFDDFVVWPASEPPNSLVGYTTDTPTEHLSSESPASTDLGDIDDVSLRIKAKRAAAGENCQI
jgi:hypothetical protein